MAQGLDVKLLQNQALSTAMREGNRWDEATENDDHSLGETAELDGTLNSLTNPRNLSLSFL